MARSTARVLAVLELLQANGRMTGAELARRLEVDARTVRRYIVRLEEMGIPVTAEHGRHGGYSLVAGYKLPPMMFDQDEALALALGLLAARGLGLANAAPAVASAQAKLERVMPRGLEQRLSEAEETVQLDLAGGGARPRDNAALITLTSAARGRRRVRLGYRSAAGELSERRFDPYGLAHRGGGWYVVGWCHLREGLRSFRLDRVTTVSELTEQFERPEGFDALRHLSLSLATLPRRHAAEVLLETDLPTARRHLFESLGTVEPTPGGVLLRIQADDLAWLARELSRLPFCFRIRRPRALRQALRRHAEALLGCSSAQLDGELR
jgi:predicted DNA-binding transcriptional regulator YafY